MNAPAHPVNMLIPFAMMKSENMFVNVLKVGLACFVKLISMNVIVNLAKMEANAAIY
jgi:hypothetical protein